MFYLPTILPLLVALTATCAPTTATPIHLNNLVKKANNQLIYSNRDQKCLSPQGGAPAVSAGQVGAGTPVISVDCASAAGWDINPGSESVILTGTSLALDAGSTPTNGGLLKVWTSYPGLYQQTWYFTDDKRIAITGGTQCLDEGASGPQTYQCTAGNTNQVWNVRNKPATPPPTGVLPDVPKGTVYTDPTTGGRRIHPYGRDDLCMTVQGGAAVIGTPVEITYCFPNNSTNAQYQLWDTAPYGTTGLIRLHSNSNLCLDAGSTPSNNGVVKVWTCGSGWAQQQWQQFASQGLVQTANNQCLDVQLGSQPSNQPNYPNQGVLQTYQCYPGSQQQNFHLLN